MNSIRLLPVVVALAAMLLVFKALGLVSGSGYLLAGLEPGRAQEADPAAAAAPDETSEAPPADAVDGMLEPASGPTDMADLVQQAIADNGEGGDGGDGGEDAMAADSASPDEMPTADPNEAMDEGGEAMDAGGTETADASPVQQTEGGEIVPFGDGEPVSETERQILVRLAERRAELDALAAELETRAAVVEAAELRLEERIAELTALEDEVNALLAERQAIDDAQFAALVAMYEAMKPKDAAAIFDRLNIEILRRVAIAMNPRKMSPILAEMSPERAEILTIQLASVDTEPMRVPTESELDALPQIVGQ